MLSLALPFLFSIQIEYMVVSFDEAGKNARLSLRQSEILKELAVEEAEAITAMPGAALVVYSDLFVASVLKCLGTVIKYPSSTPSTAGICSNPHLEHRTERR